MYEEVFRPPKRGQPGHRTVRIIGVPGSRTWGVGGRRISAPPYHPCLWVIWVMNLNPSSHPGTAEPPPPLLPLVSFPPPTQQITLLPYTRCSQVLTGMCKYQSSGSNFKIMYFLTSDAKDISNMHLNFQSYWSFLRAMVNLDLHVNMLTPSRAFMRLSLSLEMLTFFKFCF